ncbi:hypothetical protein MBLNU13_g06447t2 [Cladosporium sp. NU13]
MARKNGFRELLSEFRRGYIKQSRAYWTASARAIRSTHGPTNEFQESPAFISNIRKVQELPSLFRQGFRLEYADKRPGNFNAILYMNDATKVSRQHLAADIARHTIAGMAGTLSQWELATLVSRKDPHSSTENISSFVLSVVTNPNKQLKNIGPRSFPGPLTLNVELHLRPKTSPLLAAIGKSVDEPRQSVDEFVRELLDDLQQSVFVCKFTSVVFLNEAVAMHLKDSFGRSKYNQYLELESVRVLSGWQVSGNQIRWIHEPPTLNASLYEFSLGKGIESHMIDLRHRKSPEVAEVEATPATSAQNVSNEKVKIRIHPYTLDLSVASNAQTNFTPSAIASRFEQGLARNNASDLPSMLDSFLAVLPSLPNNFPDPMSVRISQDASPLSTSHASSSSQLSHSVEFKKGTGHDSVKVSMHTDLRRSFQLRFSSEEWSDRRIQVKRVLFQLSPIDAVAVNSLLNSPLSEQVNIEQEMNNLATNTATIVQKVCEGVKFDDITTVTGYLAEAVLRVVRPLTEEFVLESVSMEVVIGDDPVTLTKSVSLADLAARTRTPERHTSPLDHVELSSGYQATQSQALTKLPSGKLGKAGFSEMGVQLLTHAVAGHESISLTREAVDTLGSGLPASEEVDCYALQTIVLASKCRADFDGYAFGHPYSAADKVAEMVLEPRSELRDHFDAHTVSVHLILRLNDQTRAELAEQDDTLYEAKRELASPAQDIDRTRIPRSSTGVSVCKDAVAIKALLQELDSKLLSITSTSTDGAIASDDIARPAQLDSKANRRGQMRRGVVVALGSNVGNRVEEIEKACRAIDADPDMRIVDTSFLYETKPMYVEDQERFVNGACEIETSLTPIELLDRLQAIEQGHGRVKLVDKGPRNIDLDIAIFRDEIVETERLTVPHLLMHEREFVLRPIMDLRSVQKWRNPRSKESLLAMFNKIIQPGLVDKDSTEPMDVVAPLTTDAMIYPMDPCRKTLVMSILNTTPDSFSDGKSNTLDPLSLRETAAAHIAAGATIIDVGGQSSRPNAPDVTAEEEINRVLPAIAAIKSLPEAEGIAISVDTYRAAVAEAAVNAGAHIVNDISAGALDPHMLSTVARLGCTYIMMHMRGSPATMQSPENCTYGRLQHEILSELEIRVALAIKAGVRRWRIVLDPGIGFAKTQDQNLELLRIPLVRRNAPPGSARPSGLARTLSRMPHLVGCSRKGFIGNITGVTEPKDRIFGTAAAVTASVRIGADIVRVHDVQEMAQAAKMADAIYRFERNSF